MISLILVVFVYPPDQDSVLEVDKDAYDTCNTNTYIEKYDDGSTSFTLNRSGPFYFISGVEANCLKNESLVVVVMGDRSNRGASTGANPPTPPPSPSSSTASPEPSPSPPPPSPELSPPSPLPPSPEQSPPSPPPPESAEVTPAPAPVGEEPNFPPPPPPNGAASRVVGFTGLVGSFLGSILYVL